MYNPNEATALKLGKELTIRNYPKILLDFITKSLTFPNPEYNEKLRRGEFTKAIPEKITYFIETADTISVPRGVYRDVIDFMASFNIEFTIESELADVPAKFPDVEVKLRDYQIQPVKDAIKEFLVNPSFMLLSPAGSGKTVLALAIAQRLKQKTLWLTDLELLANQAAERAKDFLNIPIEDIGRIVGPTCNIKSPLTIGMVPTMYNMDLTSLEKEFGFIVVDEVQSIPTKRFLNVVGKLAPRFTLGLTATAHREDGLTDAIYRLVGGAKVKPKAGGIIYPKIIKRPTGSRYNVDERILDKYKFVLDRMIIKDVRRNKMIVDDIAKDFDKFITVVLTRSIDHMELIHNSLAKDYGIESTLIHSKMKAATRKSNKDEFENGGVNIMIATYNMLRKGYDYQLINRVFWAFPFSSKEWIIQTIGRASREAPGKRGAVVLDYVDNGSMLEAQAKIRERVCREEGLHVLERNGKEYLTNEDKDSLFYKDD